MNSIITRFAPSPTGNLHIGGIRTALINYIVTQKIKKDGKEAKFLLRIEDTDKKRSTNQYKKNIIDGLNWLNIKHDEKTHLQSDYINRHKEVAYELIKNNKAFKCICTQDELEHKRNENKKLSKNIKRLCSKCENNNEIQSLEKGFVVRISISPQGATSINDIVQGNITIKNNEIDNFILLRKDGSPTYMLSVVVDDFDMGVNLIIRGDDHLNNAFRQIFIYKNMNWQIPKYAHIPLIHGEDGKKLSKRHGAVNINEFKSKGYIKEGIINNLILLGWAPPNENEIISIENIINSFDLNKISKSSSIFDYKKLNYFNNYYIKNDKNLKELFNYCNINEKLKDYLSIDKNKFIRIFEAYKEKLNFYESLEFIGSVYYDEYFKTKKNILFNEQFNILINKFIIILSEIKSWETKELEKIINTFIKNNNIKFPLFGKPTRLLLINEENGPSISEILHILGKKNSIQRINNYINDN